MCQIADEIHICSPFNDSADYYIIDEFIHLRNNGKNEKSPKCLIYYPNEENIEEKIGEVDTNELLEKKPITIEEVLEENKWLIAQIAALEKVENLVVIGGNIGKTAEQLIEIAIKKGKKIIPLCNTDGLTRELFYRFEFTIPTQLKELITKYNGEEIKEEVLSNIDKSSKKVFISYPREKTTVADFLEVLIRRKNIVVFRDESSFIPGASIQDEIMNKLNASNIFISLWCMENACSPWCYDEFIKALEKKEKGEMQIIIMALDDTRMIHKGARDIIANKINSRSDMQYLIESIL